MIITRKKGKLKTPPKVKFKAVKKKKLMVKPGRVREYNPKHPTFQKMNVVKGARRGYGEADPGSFPHKNIIRTGNIVKEVNVDIFKDRPYRKKK